MNPPALFKRLLMGLGALTLALAALGVLFGVILVRRGFSTRDNPSWLETQVAGFLRSLSVPARVREMKNPIQPSSQVLAEAKAHWADHCALCHGNDGSGRTDLARHLYPKVPDMRAAATQGLTDGEFYAVIKNGVRLTGMLAWGEPGDEDADSWALVHFIRHLPSLTPAELEGMKALNPRSAHEQRESADENEFLNGDSP